MHIELISIGDELLTGKTVNTNVAFMGSALLEEGFIVNRTTTISDDHSVILPTLQTAFATNTLTIVTGGLGPTLDDCTRQAAAAVTGCSLTLNQTVAEHLRRRFGHSIDEQATIPEKATPLLNNIGTAPGLLFEQEGHYLILLPGVPLEMEELFTTQVIPFLQKTFVKETRPFVFSVQMHSTKEADVDPILRELSNDDPEIQFGIYPDMWLVTVRLMVLAKTEEEAKAFVEKPIQRIKEAFFDRLFEGPTLQETLHKRFIEKKLTLSGAESCTGGAISSSLFRLPGASNYFLGSVIAYSYEIKTELLGVSKELLGHYGAVSAEVVHAMAQGIQERTKSDFAFAVSGIAGPTGGTPDKPVGTVWCALATPTSVKTWKLSLTGSRDSIIRSTTNLVLGELLSLTSK